MIDNLTALLVVSYAVALLFGASVTYLAYRAYRRTGAFEMGILSLGLGLLTVGMVAHGSFGRILAGDGVVRSVVPAVLSAAGFGFLLYSLYAGRDRTGADSSS